MKVELENLISITEANQNFSKVTRLVDKMGPIVILKNNMPKYVVMEYKKVKEENTESQLIEDAADKIIQKHIKAFRELAK